jgi:hypothetical protein
MFRIQSFFWLFLNKISSSDPVPLNFYVQFKNQFRGLDDDEVDFLDRVDDMRTEAEKVLF